MTGGKQGRVRRWQVLLVALGLWGGSAQAFDGAMQVEPSYLNPENFLDIQSYQFRPEQERAWRRAAKGWRSTGGSLGLDLLFSQLQVKLRHPLARGFEAALVIDHEEFYEVKPLRYLVEVQWKATEAIGIGFIGMPQYDKRNADEGGALTLGSPTGSFLRLSHLRQNLFYNEKNFYDDTRQNPHPIENTLQGAWLQGPWEVALKARWDLPMRLEDPTREFVFQHEGQEQQALVEFQDAASRFWGWEGRQVAFDKSRAAPASEPEEDRRSEKIRWQSHTLQVDGRGSGPWAYGLGLRWDAFRNTFTQVGDPASSEDFQLTSWQAFGILREVAPETAWEYGLYWGSVNKEVTFADPAVPPEEEPSLQGKLRVSWELLASDEQGSWMITTTWNLDGLPRDFWDGGNMTYQQTF